MLGADLMGGALGTARLALNGLAQRQQAIAGNIANIDTPGYQRRSVDFEDTLRRQSSLPDSSGKLPRTLAVTNARHFAMPQSIGGTLPPGAATERDVVSQRNDNNVVSVDEEMTLLAETQIRYQALTQTMGKQIGILRSVIRGQ